jgi:hypothetical protein
MKFSRNQLQFKNCFILSLLQKLSTAKGVQLLFSKSKRGLLFSRAIFKCSVRDWVTIKKYVPVFVPVLCIKIMPVPDLFKRRQEASSFWAYVVQASGKKKVVRKVVMLQLFSSLFGL